MPEQPGPPMVTDAIANAELAVPTIGMTTLVSAAPLGLVIVKTFVAVDGSVTVVVAEPVTVGASPVTCSVCDADVPFEP